MLPIHPISTLFPYTTLFRSPRRRRRSPFDKLPAWIGNWSAVDSSLLSVADVNNDGRRRHVCLAPRRAGPRDRKSTRLNSSHSQISYAVFCLKKKRYPLGRYG